eukprot:403340796
MQKLLQKHQLLKIEAKTWVRDSHGLYDYESSQLNVQSLKVTGSFFCMRKETDVRIEKPSMKLIKTDESNQQQQTQAEDDQQIIDPTKQEILFKGAYKHGKYYIYHKKSLSDNKFEDSSQMMWLILKQLDLKAMKFSNRKVIDDKHLSRYPLSQGEIIKFGRVAYKIFKIYKPNKNPIITNKQSSIVGGVLDVTQTEGDAYHTKNCDNWDDIDQHTKIPDLRPTGLRMSESNGKDFKDKGLDTKRPQTAQVCRICLCEDELENNNPLISACKCSGTMSQIHVKCINEWLNSKRETRVSATTHSYQWTTIECELCQQKFPDQVLATNGKFYKIFDFDEPENDDSPYIVFQSMYQSKKVKTFHVVFTSKRKITKVGRAYETDMRVPDISVSRLHAQIILKNDQFYLEDLESKFGTLEDALKEEIHEFSNDTKGLFPREVTKLIENEDFEQSIIEKKHNVEQIRDEYSLGGNTFENPYVLTARQLLATSNEYDTVRNSDSQTNFINQLSITHQVSADNQIRQNYERRRAGGAQIEESKSAQNRAGNNNRNINENRNPSHIYFQNINTQSANGGGGRGQSSFISQPQMLTSHAMQEDDNDDPQVEEIINSILYDNNNDHHNNHN